MFLFRLHHSQQLINSIQGIFATEMLWKHELSITSDYVYLFKTKMMNDEWWQICYVRLYQLEF